MISLPSFCIDVNRNAVLDLKAVRSHLSDPSVFVIVMNFVIKLLDFLACSFIFENDLSAHLPSCCDDRNAHPVIKGRINSCTENNICLRINLAGNDKSGLFLIDKELGGMAVAPAGAAPSAT